MRLIHPTFRICTGTIILMPLASEILGHDGPLSKAIPGFIARESQLKMAEAIERALKQPAELIIEAGTGTGKTFGYLVPIFISQKKTIISTGTKNLQDQLFFKDIPIIKSLFPFPRKIELLKGRANYLCLHRLEKSLQDGRFASKHEVSYLYLIQEWKNQTQTGDLADISSVPEDAAIWPQVTSTVDNCLNQDCQFYKDCFVMRARQKAKTADILVVNHHLFFADMALQEEGFGELLGGAEVVLFDEAHHLPDIATQFFSTTFGSRQIMELIGDTTREVNKEAKDMTAILMEATHKLEDAVRTMRMALGSAERRAPWPETPDRELTQSIVEVKNNLQLFETILNEASCRSKELENCRVRTVKLMERFNTHTLSAIPDMVHWFETYLKNFTIQLTPLTIAEEFKKYIKDHKRTWIFTSATLTVQKNFQLFIDSLGLNQALQLFLESPFDYQKQALLYVPRGLPDCHESSYTDRMIDAVIPVLEITQGRAFLLFTSFKALLAAAELLKNRIPYPLLVQGTLPKSQLINEFKRLGNAVLLGTSSFWSGVDVRGEALSCVVIDKLPFATPDDPILQARIQRLRKQGIDPFQTYQLPNAVLILKQGAGRLIRDNADRGILMICDPRIVGARYGQIFLQSLPNMARTRDFNNLRSFLTYETTGT